MASRVQRVPPALLVPPALRELAAAVLLMAIKATSR